MFSRLRLAGGEKALYAIYITETATDFVNNASIIIE